MNNEMFDILELCLQELENGFEIENILSRFPNIAEDLRPILTASLQAKKLAATSPSQDTVLRGRTRLMQTVAEMREEKSMPRKRAIPFFQRIALTIAITSTLLLSGTGLVGASSSALPGQNLYPVKRGWEDVRLFFTFNEDERISLEQQFEGERLNEVDELLSNEDRHLVDFSGISTRVSGKMYVSNVQVLFPADAEIPPEGDPLHITGWTTESDYVEIISFEILPDASTIPINSSIVTPDPTKVNENKDGGADKNKDEKDGDD